MPFLTDVGLLTHPELAGAGAGPVELTLLHALFLVQSLIASSPGPTIRFAQSRPGITWWLGVNDRWLCASTA